MKKFILAPFLIFILSSVIFSSDMFSYIPYKSAAWDNKITTESENEKTVFTQKVWYKNKMMRMEQVMKNQMTGKKEKQVVIITKKHVYIITPSEKSGFKYSLDSKNNPVASQMNFNKHRKNAKKTGSGKAGNVKCDIYEYTVSMDIGASKIKTRVKEWRAKKDGFIIKSLSKTDPYKIMGRAIKGTTSISEISKLKKNKKIKDSMFKVPKGIEIKSMDAMMNQSYKLLKSNKGKKVPPGYMDSIKDKAKDDAVNELMKGFMGD